MSEERKFELRDENFVVVQGWMIKELGLIDSELIVYAIIFQYSQEKNSWCYASMEYMAEWLTCSTKTIQRIINSLIEKKIVIKQIATNETGRFNIYKAFRRPLDSEIQAEDSEGGQDNLSAPYMEGVRTKPVGGSGQNHRGGQDKIDDYTIIGNKEENKKENKSGANAPAPHKTSRFSKPSISEIAAYCSEKNISIDPASFYYFYESKGWKVGNTQMKNWKAAIQTWVKRSRNGYGSSYSAKPNSCGHNNPEGFDEL